MRESQTPWTQSLRISCLVNEVEKISPEDQKQFSTGDAMLLYPVNHLSPDIANAVNGSYPKPLILLILQHTRNDTNH